MQQLDQGEGWLTSRWRDLRRNLTAALRRRSNLFTGPLLEHDFSAGNDALDAAWRNFIDEVVRDLEVRRRGARAELREMFGVAISLLGDADVLRKQLMTRWERAVAAQEAAKLDPDKEFQFVLKVALREMRRKMFNATPAHQTTWNRLDEISRKLGVSASLSGRLAAHDRCSRTHFREVLAYCREKHPNDSSLPRTLEKVEEYFYLNCPDCTRDVPDDSSNDALSAQDEYSDILSVEEIMLLPDVHTRLLRLKTCLLTLDSQERQVIEMAYGLGEVAYPSVAIFCATAKISRRSFYDIRRRAELTLAQCVLALRV